MSTRQRCYVPLTLDAFAARLRTADGPAPETSDGRDRAGGQHATHGHGTNALIVAEAGAQVCAVEPGQLALGGEEAELAEYEAFAGAAALAAGLATAGGAASRRLVLAADAPRGALEQLEGRIHRLREPLRLADVVSGHVDEPEAVARARAGDDGAGGDEEAAAALADEDLLWYDVSELGDLAAEASRP
ncbi:DUF6912 family protein [Sediminivirga luteola]|uniref:Uncharacterized protein n=1 Tax=Sediminivirga luteola TaxID=1774748 RepID=A0A8J2TYV1_9MICO|nr:hypothetical protein [Sediminivirga luteola]GGA18278.1 hypothetical protein GCM10011333_21650 [Sediminivirga luteola]